MKKARMGSLQTFVAHDEAAKMSEPGEGRLDDPPVAARHYPVSLENQAPGAPVDPGCGRPEVDLGGGLA